MAPLPQPFLRRQFKLTIQFRARLFSVYEIAEAASHAPLATVQATARLPKVRDGRQFAIDGPCGVPPRVERVTGLLRRVFVLESRVNVADQI